MNKYISMYICIHKYGFVYTYMQVATSEEAQQSLQQLMESIEQLKTVVESKDRHIDAAKSELW